jgi:plasmid stabilization system protein ParE
LNKLPYFYSVKAASDLDDLLTYTKRYYGESKVQELAQSLTYLIEELLTNFEMGKPRFDIAKGLRSLPWLKWLIFYWVLENRFLIARMLHQSRDYTRIDF